MKAAYALYSDPAHAQGAVDALRTRGTPDAAIVVLSAEPVEDWEFGQRDHKTAMRGIAVLGSVLGLAFGASLTSVTQLLWPLDTGGMPIVTLWPNLIITFEMTMLGAILATVITLIASGGLCKRLPPLYDPEVSEGKILVGVADPSDDEVPSLEQALAGGEFRTIP